MCDFLVVVGKGVEQECKLVVKFVEGDLNLLGKTVELLALEWCNQTSVGSVNTVLENTEDVFGREFVEVEDDGFGQCERLRRSGVSGADVLGECGVLDALKERLFLSALGAEALNEGATDLALAFDFLYLVASVLQGEGVTLLVRDVTDDG